MKADLKNKCENKERVKDCTFCTSGKDYHFREVTKMIEYGTICNGLENL